MMSPNISRSSKLDQELSEIRSRLANMMLAANDGIISGLEVTSVGNTISVSSGALFLGGSVFEVAAIDGLHVDMTPGVSGYVFVCRSDSVTYGVDDYMRTVATGSEPKATIVVTSDIVDGIALACFEVVNNIVENADGEIVASDAFNIQPVSIPGEAPYVVQVGAVDLTSATVTRYLDAEVYTYTPGSVAHGCFTYETSGRFLFHSSNAGERVEIAYHYMKPIEEPLLVIDVSNSRFVALRPQFTLRDTKHCLQDSTVGSNVHGVTFNDMNQNFPLHSQIFDTGFSTVPKSDVDGMLGSLVVESYKPFAYVSGLVTKYRFLLDMFGLITGTPGRQYVRLKYTPLVVTYVVNKSTRAPIWFEVYDNAVAFGTSAEFNASEIEVGYTAVRCLDTVIRDDNSVTLLGGDDTIVISEGREVGVAEDIAVNLGAYTGVPLELTVSLASDASPVLLPSIVDSAKLSTRTSSDFQRPVALNGQAQLAVTLRNSPVQNALKPPAGRLSVVTDTSLIYGRRRFLYTYSKDNTVLSIVNKASTAISDEYNLSGSYVRRGDEIVEHDAWMYVADKKRVVVATSIYENVASPRFLLWSGAALSSRNRRGYVEVSGTAQAPAGPRATCSIKRSAYAVQDKDAFTYTARDVSITKTYRIPNSTFSGYDTNAIAGGILVALSSEPLVQRSGMTFECVGNTVIMRSAQASDLTVYCANACALVSNFTLVDGVYVASIEVLSTRFQSGDYISLRVDSSSSPVTKSWRTEDAFESEAFDLDVLASAFNADPVFSSTGATLISESNTLILTSGDAGTSGNTNTFSTTSRAVTSGSFSGGSDSAVPRFNDVSGTVLLLEDEQEYDKTGVFHVYCTDNLDSGASDSKYFHVGDIEQYADVSTYQLTLDASKFNTSDSIDISEEFMLEILVSGADASGNSIAETIVINPLNFCEYIDAANGETNELQFVRTANLFASVTQWAVTEKKNIGNTEVVLLSELTSGSRDLYEVSTLEWNGSVIQGKTDRRRFVPSTTYQDPSLVIGEAVGTMSSLFKVVL